MTHGRFALICWPMCLVRWKCPLGPHLVVPNLDWSARPSPLNCKTSTQSSHNVEANCSPVSSRRVKKPRCREMSARGYAPHSVCPQLSFLFVVKFVYNDSVCYGLYIVRMNFLSIWQVRPSHHVISWTDTERRHWRSSGESSSNSR